MLEELDRISNLQAVSRYRDTIEDLRTEDFKVLVCPNHSTLPLWIHDPIIARDTNIRTGPKGWADKATVIEFTKYAAYVAWKFGDIVDNWVTFNEPMVPETGYLTTVSGSRQVSGTQKPIDAFLSPWLEKEGTWDARDKNENSLFMSAVQPFLKDTIQIHSPERTSVNGDYRNRDKPHLT